MLMKYLWRWKLSNQKLKWFCVAINQGNLSDCPLLPYISLLMCSDVFSEPFWWKHCLESGNGGSGCSGVASRPWEGILGGVHSGVNVTPGSRISYRHVDDVWQCFGCKTWRRHLLAPFPYQVPNSTFTLVSNNHFKPILVCCRFF